MRKPGQKILRKFLCKVPWTIQGRTAQTLQGGNEVCAWRVTIFEPSVMQHEVQCIYLCLQTGSNWSYMHHATELWRSDTMCLSLLLMQQSTWMTCCQRSGNPYGLCRDAGNEHETVSNLMTLPSDFFPWIGRWIRAWISHLELILIIEWKGFFPLSREVSYCQGILGILSWRTYLPDQQWNHYRYRAVPMYLISLLFRDISLSCHMVSTR